MQFIRIAPSAARAAALALTLVFFTGTATAQNGDLEMVRQQAETLVTESRMTDALPLLQQLVDAGSESPKVHAHYGFALLAKAATSTDTAEATAARIAAKKAFSRARELGDRSLVIAEIADTLPADGSQNEAFSANATAEAFMKKGEAAFVSGRRDDAFDYYQLALNLDPKLYLAALFSGDVKLQAGEFDQAEFWYQRAIKIDPNIETAYRYSATPLMRQRKFNEARDRYIEAFITEPYNRRAIGGLIQWGEATETNLGHPRLDVPETTTGDDGKESTTINVNPLADDGSMAWIAYPATRTLWEKEKFKQTFPNQQYRHTLMEEADALRSVLTMVKELKVAPDKLNPQFVVLKQLDDEGLLEAYILIARPNEGIAQDHAAYLRDHRDKLRQYVLKYVINRK